MHFFIIFCSIISIKSAYILDSEGLCGDNLIYSIKSDNVIISGSGQMYNYSFSSELPWKSVTSAIFEDGVTSIGQFAFYYCTNLMSIKIPESVLSIESSAFEGCEKFFIY